MQNKILLGLLLPASIFLLPRPAHAYVDPGLIGSLYQAIYVLVFGVIAGWILKPYRFFRSLFRKSGDRDGGDQE